MRFFLALLFYSLFLSLLVGLQLAAEWAYFSVNSSQLVSLWNHLTEFKFQAIFVLWLGFNITVSSVCVSWLRRGSLNFRSVGVLSLASVLWLGGVGWLYSAWLHLNEAQTWNLMHTQTIRDFIIEGLSLPTLTLYVASICFCALTGWATLVWLRFTTWQPRRFFLGLGWMTVTLLLMRWLSTTQTSSWSLLSFSLPTLFLSIALIGQFEHPDSTPSHELQDGWKELDHDEKKAPLPSPVPIVCFSTASMLSACWAQYTYCILGSPRGIQDARETLTQKTLHLSQYYQSHQLELKHIQWFSILSLVSVLGLGLVLLVRQRELLHPRRNRYKNPMLSLFFALVLIAGSAFYYSQRSHSLVFQHMTPSIHGIAHSLKSYHTLPPKKAITPLQTPSQNIHRSGIFHLVFFPLPLLSFGETNAIANLSLRELSFNNRWRTQQMLLNGHGLFRAYPQLSRAQRIARIQRTLRKTLRQGPSKYRTQEVYFIVHPKIPTKTFITVIEQAKQMFPTVFLLLATPHIWHNGNASIPFFSHFQRIRVKLKTPTKKQPKRHLEVTSRGRTQTVSPKPNDPVYQWIVPMFGNSQKERK